jgi:group I intron endonuclease
MGYIYKITNTITGKLYVGETAQEDPYVRWKGHQEAFRRGRGCPALRDAVKKYGIENFRFEVLVICFDDARFDMEREYIKRLNTMVPNGYNILEGGLGGAGFKGKTHSEETKMRLREISTKLVSDPEYKKKASERARAQMKKAKEEGVNLGKLVKESEKYRKALEEGRVGSAGRLDGVSEESRKKVSESLKKYYQNCGPTHNDSASIKRHRNAMAKAVGVKVQKLDLENNLIATYESIAEAARSIGRNTNTISQCFSGKCKTAGGFKWKKVTESTVAESKIEHIEAT